MYLIGTETLVFVTKSHTFLRDILGQKRDQRLQKRHICEKGIKHLQMYAVCLAFFALNLASDFEHSVAPKKLPIQIGKRSILLGYEGR